MMKAILVHGIAPSLIDPPAGECIVVESHRMGQVGRTEEETGAGIWGRARVIDLFFSPIRSHIQPRSKADCQPYFRNSLDDAFERGFEVVSVPNIVLVLVKRVRKCLSDREYRFLFSLSGSLTRQQMLLIENFHQTSSSRPLYHRVRVVGPNPLRPL